MHERYIPHFIADTVSSGHFYVVFINAHTLYVVLTVLLLLAAPDLNPDLSAVGLWARFKLVHQFQ